MDNRAEEYFNRSYFIFPLKVKNIPVLKEFLVKNNWEKASDSFKDVNYVLNYAKNLSVDNSKFETFIYTKVERISLNMFLDIPEKYDLGKISTPPKLDKIKIYIFGTKIAFLEFDIKYENVTIDEIVTFVYCFRSLRYNTDRYDWLKKDNVICVRDAIKTILPFDDNYVKVCFSNDSSIKQQAVIFTLIDTELLPGNELTKFDLEKYAFYLSHGYSRSFAYEKDEATTDREYEALFSVNDTDFWGCCQDGIACITNNAYNFMYSHLSNDYHFMHLLLLNQRFSAIDLIEEFANNCNEKKEMEKLSKRATDLKIAYAFRIMSDDTKMQSFYNKMYKILVIDELMNDVEDANERITELHIQEERKNEKWRNTLLGGISILAIFSALIDLASYFNMWGVKQNAALVSLIINVGIIVGFLFFTFKRKK